ncbi:MAG: hypothetical protein JRJ65_15055 [Deltaproteobacteria bacterium]|nr:hypothetical protein [Deltaproteobacteria bacterium]
MKYKNKTFNEEKILLDGNEYFGCTFNNCEVEYSGGKPPFIEDCEFHSPCITFSGNASDTINFLTALYHGGFKPIIEKTFENIRSNVKPSAQRTFH